MGLNTCMEDRSGELRDFIVYVFRKTSYHVHITSLDYLYIIIGFILNFNRIGYPNYLCLSSF